MSKSFYHKITDEQWKIIELHLLKPKSTGRHALNSRTVFNAIFRVLDSGAKWRYLPKEFGNWNSIYHKFRKWCELGVFENQDIGISRGGKTTKIHALVNEHFQLVSVELSGGNIHDSEMAIKLLSKVTLEGKKIPMHCFGAFCTI